MRNGIKLTCLIWGLCGSMAWPAFAQAEDAETQDLRQRVASLERRIEGLERLLQRVPEGSSVASVEPAPSPQDAAGGRPTTVRTPFATPPELIPEVGKIGAEVGLLVAGSANPFHLAGGTFASGFIDLPLVDKPDWLHGKISYEILVGMSQSNTKMKITSNVAQVANLTVLDTLNPNGGLANVTAAVSGTGPAPFPVTVPVTTKLRLLQVVPFAFKYTTVALDRWRIRPYAVLGFGTYVTIHAQYPLATAATGLGLRADASVPPDILAALNQLFGGNRFRLAARWSRGRFPKRRNSKPLVFPEVMAISTSDCTPATALSTGLAGVFRWGLTTASTASVARPDC